MSPTITVASLFSWRFSREKRPTLTVATFFLSFFLSDYRPHRVCTTFYRLHSRSHVLVSTRFTAVTGSSPCFSQKLFRAIFFGTVRLFQFFFGTLRLFSIFFCRQKVPPSSFLIFCSKLKFQTAQKVFTILGTFRFLSLRYSADFRRSRLVKAMN